MAQVLTVIILAAGQGTRMKSALPKVLHPVAGVAMVAYAIDAALALKPARVVVVVGHGREQVEAAVTRRFGSQVEFALQTQQRGTADAVRCALPRVSPESTDVLITYGDCPLVSGAFLQSLVSARQRKTGSLLSVATAQMQDATGYGRMLHDGNGSVVGIREHKDCTEQERAITVINAGMYSLDAAFLRDKLETISTHNAQGEFYLTDLVALAATSGAAGVAEVRADPSLLQGVNDRADLAAVESMMLAQIADSWRRAGNNIAPGARIERDVTLAHDICVGAGAVLRGKTQVNASATIDVGCVLEDAIIGANALLKPYTIVSKSAIGDGAQLGPFAHIRPDSTVGDGAHVGNFVELKKTVMHNGAKANHLAYLGDGVIGESANIGAGTIFCNYDGFQKHTTTVEKNAFVGSNSSLVAPVVIGEGAYVGSGSVVTRDVPKDALAIGRARQENKEGRAATLRALKKKK
jgi:bifunctional UDP-N-acetylglucosamine pyrophosphorylase/glucosamine-1-phosphate N-acetyltransferase